jgi:hypothetical protein
MYIYLFSFLFFLLLTNIKTPLLPGGHRLLDFIEFNYTVEVDGHIDIVWFIRSYLSWNKSTVWSLAGIISRWVSEVCENRSWSIFDIGFHCVANPRHGGALSELKQRLKDDGEEVEKGSWLGRHDGNINTGPPSRFYEHLVEVDSTNCM